MLQSQDAGHVEWKWEAGNSFPADVLSDGAANILFAPSPRIRLDPPAGFGRSIAAVLESEGELPGEWMSKPEALSQNFDYATKIGLVSVRLLKGLNFCGPSPQVTVDGPGETKVLDPEQIKREKNEQWVLFEDIARTTKVTIPIQWQASDCK